MIGFNIGAQTTKFSLGKVSSNKIIKNLNDFKENILLNNNSEKIILSIIQFKESERLYGESSKLNKNYYLSTFNNLSRLIGFMYNLEMNNIETKYFNTLDNYDKELTAFYFNFNSNFYKFPSEYCVCAFLSKVLNTIKLNNNEIKKFIFSIPDYYTYYQKESLKNILLSLDIKNNFHFLNESTALTMYYGCLNYQQLTNENKYLIFIDSGHSKTSFILSEFSKKKFIVKEVENILFFGGRDFNKAIFNFCLEKFKKEHKRPLKLNIKNKIELIEEIEKIRINLSINNEVEINIKSIEENIDFKHKIKRKEFEQLIYEEINDFKKKFKSFYNKVKRYEPEKIVIGNQLMNTPILEKIIKEISHLPILKTINFNECHSLGSLLYETFILENNKFEELEYVKSYNMYSIYYSINNSNKQILIKKGENIPNEGSINLNNIAQFNYIVNLNVFYDKNEFKNLGIDKIKNFYTYNIDLNNLFVKNKILFLDYSIDESNELILKLNNSNILDFGLKINIKNSFSNKAIIKSYKELEKYFKTKDKNI